MTNKQRQVRLGFLYPGHSAEDDYPRMAELLNGGLHIEVVHTSVGEDAHRVDALLDLGSSARLLEGAAELKRRGVHAVMWACTSGSFVFGSEGARQQAAEIEELVGVPASSTSIAFVEAVRSVGARRVAIAATYPDDVARAFAAYLAAADIETVAVGSEGIVTAEEVGTFGRERVVSFVTSGDHEGAEAVLVPDTALHTVAWIEQLEDAVRKPVLTANIVTMWQALRLAGSPRDATELGSLFRLDV
jgi:maleate cis-trans isomerase